LKRPRRHESLGPGDSADIKAATAKFGGAALQIVGSSLVLIVTGGSKMFKSITAIAITAVATAGLMAGLVALLTSVVPEAKAEA
jgi:hypothetical protein